MRAADKGHSEVLTRLFETGVDVNATDKVSSA